MKAGAAVATPSCISKKVQWQREEAQSRSRKRALPDPHDEGYPIGPRGWSGPEAHMMIGQQAGSTGHPHAGM